MLFRCGGSKLLSTVAFLCLGLTSFVSTQETEVVSTGVGDTILSLHGSGTTNPSRCYWRIMDQLQSHAKIPIRLTYRAIGSGSGQREFFRDPPIVSFASGDIPLPNANWTEYTNDRDITLLQLPVVLGAISFFYNLPGSPQLNLTACTLGQIFARRITRWDDPAITANNPNLNVPVESLEIRVARRRDGSSSTASITSYLNIGCSVQWGEDMVGKSIDWHEDTVGCQGSGGMTNCITDVVGTIGYIDSGHGVSEGLQEVHLESIETGEFISSTISKGNNGIAGAAALPEELPSAADQDFSAVNFINKPGRFTWPIVAMSYLYVRQDITFLPPESQGLLVAFLRSLYLDEYMDQCVEDFGFTRVTGAALDLALAGIDSIVKRDGITEWIFEADTMLGVGMQDNVISAKRNSFSVVKFSEVDTETADLKSTIATLENALGEASRRIATLEGAALQPQVMSAGEEQETRPAQSVESSASYNEDELVLLQEEIMATNSRINIAMALGAVSIVLWIILIVGVVIRNVMG